MSDYLPHRSLLYLLAVLLIVIAPHLVRLPLWESAAVLGLIVWRGFASARQWGLPPQMLKLGLALGAFAAVYAGFGRITGQNAGVALLVLMLALKLTEMRSRRDVMVVVFLMYFLLITHFLFSQELWTIVYLLGCAVAITAVLIDAHHPGSAMPARASARMAAIMVAQALPLMALFFILFPRIPGPIWGLPNDAGAARSGLSDSMTPGDISSLIESDELAFRVRFEGNPPGADRLYWRGPVFDYFDGRSWSQYDKQESDAARIEPLGETVRYELTLEPMRTRWLFALDAPDPSQLPPRSRVGASGALLSERAIIERTLVRGVSSTRYRLDADLSLREQARNTRLPAGFNPRTRALAGQWQAQGLEPEQIVARALEMFRNENFVYTLEPPLLGRESVDEFLFDTRRGFCEHYSSSFAFLMRAAGVPTRVVTGYLGAEPIEIDDYWLVTQSDAHAWSEVWIAGRGWVRIDATAVVAPNRVERGLRNTLSAADGLPGFLARRSSLSWYFEARWDWVNAKWNEWVLSYGPELQEQFLRRFGLADVGRMILALTIGVSLILGLVGLVSMRRAGPPPVTERSVVLWRDIGRRLHQLGFEPRPGEGPRDFAQRVSEDDPSLAPALDRALDAYLRLRYVGEQSAQLERQLADSAKLIRR